MLTTSTKTYTNIPRTHNSLHNYARCISQWFDSTGGHMVDPILKARKDTLSELEESLSDGDIDIAIHAIDLYIDFLEVNSVEYEV